MQREIFRCDARRAATRNTKPSHRATDAPGGTVNSTKPRATKKFKSLVAVLGSEEAAVTAWNRAHPDNKIKVKDEPEALPEAVQMLVDAGFTVEQAREALAAAGETEPEAKALSSQELAEALVAKSGMIHVRGRVYTTTEIIEAQVRVLKTGKPEIVRTSGDHRIKAVAIWRTDSGDVAAVQNLGEQN